MREISPACFIELQQRSCSMASRQQILEERSGVFSQSGHRCAPLTFTTGVAVCQASLDKRWPKVERL